MDPHFSRAFPLDQRDSLLFGEKIVLEKRVFEKPESRSEDQVIYWKGTFIR